MFINIFLMPANVLEYGVNIINKNNPDSRTFAGLFILFFSEFWKIIYIIQQKMIYYIYYIKIKL